MKKILHLSVLVIALTAGACSKDSGTVNPTPIQKGSVSGKVSDANGNPIGNVKVVLEHTVWLGTYVNSVSGNDGIYKATLPTDPAGSWTAKAQVQANAYGKQYNFDLDVDNTAGFTSKDAAIRNFKWKLSGARPNGGYYGAHVDIYQWGIAVNMTDIKLLLTPIEEFLPDGSRAQVIEKRIEDVAGTFMIKDIPIGKYKVKAIYPGKTFLLQNRHDNEPATQEKVFVFGKYGFLGETDYNVEFWLSE